MCSITEMSIGSLIAEAVRLYAETGLDCAQELLPPADDVAIDQIGAALKLSVPEELRELFHVCGGQEYTAPGTTGLFGHHKLNSPAEVIEDHVMFSRCCLRDSLRAQPQASRQLSYWVPELIPFASWDAYYLCVHATSGEVWEFNPGTGLIGPWPNIAAVLHEVMDVIRAGGEPQLKFYAINSSRDGR